MFLFKSPLCLPRLHLFDLKKYSKNSNIVEYMYNVQMTCYFIPLYIVIVLL